MKPTVCFLMFAQQATWVKGNMMTGQRKRKRCVLNQALHCTRRRHLKMGTVSSSVMTTSPLSVQKRQQEVILAGLLYVESISDDDNTMAKEHSLRRGSEDILGSLPIKHLKQGENPPTPAFMCSTAMILATFSIQHEKKAVKQRRSYNLNIFTWFSNEMIPYKHQWQEDRVRTGYSSWEFKELNRGLLLKQHSKESEFQNKF